jgi:hypothetical protein
MIDKNKIDNLEIVYGIKILPVRIIGRRWAFDGSVQTNIPIGEMKRLQIDSNTGCIVYNWNLLNDSQQRIVEQSLMTP